MTILYRANNKKPEKKTRIVPPIPLDKPEKKQLKKGEHQSCKPRSTPAQTESLTHELAVPHFGVGTPEECLTFRTDFDKVCVGQNVTTGPGQCALARRSLVGDALTVFNNHAGALNQESVENCKKCLNTVRDSVFPCRAAATQKQCMRHFLKKPLSVTTREWLARVFEINKCLPRFPPSGDPPVAVTKLDQDKLRTLSSVASLTVGLSSSVSRTLMWEKMQSMILLTSAKDSKDQKKRKVSQQSTQS